MIHEEKMKAMGCLLYTICEAWEDTRFLPRLPYRAFFSNDVDTFLLTFSDHPVEILEKMKWFPGTFSSSETVLNIYKELAELQPEFPAADMDIPKIIQYSKSHRNLSEQISSTLTDHTEHFYAFFDLFGHWILEQNESDEGRKEKLETTLQFLRDYIES